MHTPTGRAAVAAIVVVVVVVVVAPWTAYTIQGKVCVWGGGGIPPLKKLGQSVSLPPMQ